MGEARRRAATALKGGARVLHGHWFRPASLRDLALVRIVVVSAQLFLFLLPLDAHLRKVGMDPSTWLPLPAVKVLLLPFGWGVRPEPEVLAGLVTGAWIAAWIGGIGGILGLFTRASLLLFALSNTFLRAHFYSYDSLHHTSALMIITLWILVLAPSGRALSLDALRRSRKRETGRGTLPRLGSGDLRSPMARWPLRLVQWLFVLVYLSATLSKLQNGGLDWFNGYTLAYYVAQDSVLHGTPGLSLAQNIELMRVLSVGAVLFESTFALAVLIPPLTWIYTLAGTAFHTGIYIVQEAPFFQFVVLYIVFIEPLRRRGPFAWVLRRVRTEGPEGP